MQPLSIQIYLMIICGTSEIRTIPLHQAFPFALFICFHYARPKQKVPDLIVAQRCLIH